MKINLYLDKGFYGEYPINYILEYNISYYSLNIYFKL